MKYGFYILSLLLLANLIFAQEKHLPDSIFTKGDSLTSKYKVWVNPSPPKFHIGGKTQNKTKAKGYLYQLQDSSVIISNSLKGPLIVNNFTVIPINKIETIKIRKKGKVWKSTLIGAVSGLVITLAVTRPWRPGCDSEFCYNKEVGAIGFTSGAIVGVIIGIAKIKIPINYSQRNYMDQKIRLKKYLVR